MAITILNDLWSVINLLLVCAVITATVIINILMALRMGFFFKSYRDPVGAFKREQTLKSVYDQAIEQEEISGNRL
ncbi:MAG TPA: hypothetical protein DHV22_00135 [Xanthomarina gelatinilytica]|uniref:Uncharacterized protein n=1 Tax=Xanthomarina gelatinilytica TaxID=1137281 RepID=A0A3D6BLT4_9FLAO|nr:hypothetical protein [Xanthomarina gelatinilytica]